MKSAGQKAKRSTGVRFVSGQLLACSLGKGVKAGPIATTVFFFLAATCYKIYWQWLILES